MSAVTESGRGLCLPNSQGTIVCEVKLSSEEIENHLVKLPPRRPSPAQVTTRPRQTAPPPALRPNPAPVPPAAIAAGPQRTAPTAPPIHPTISPAPGRPVQPRQQPPPSIAVRPAPGEPQHSRQPRTTRPPEPTPPRQQRARFHQDPTDIYTSLDGGGIASKMGKTPIYQEHSKTCDRIAARAKKRQFKQIGSVTYQVVTNKKGQTFRGAMTNYYTNLYKPGTPNYSVSPAKRKDACEIEGFCIEKLAGDSEEFLRSYKGARKPRSKTQCHFGYGNKATGSGETNCLDPCRTLAADQSIYPSGSVIYIPSMRGKYCPQTGKRILDPCFVVGDVGSGIKKKGRFDLFSGECTDFDHNRKKFKCKEKFHKDFHVPRGALFHVARPNDPDAIAYRKERTAIIKNGWKKPPQSGNPTGPTVIHARRTSEL